MYNSSIKCLSQAITPETTVIVFDLHNVIFKRRTGKIFASCLKLLPKGTWRYTLNPAVWYKVYRLHEQSHVAEDIFHKIALTYPGIARFRGDFIRLTNTQRPIKKNIELITELKKRGYKLYILSNIGAETFMQLRALYPEVHAHFDGAFTSSAENNYSHKPLHAFYEQFKSYLAVEGLADMQVLFIDDLKKNVDAAAQCNIAGLLYTSSRRLASSLKNLDVL